jgi:NMD protein affecting ribosome stability and mRNA decay
VGFARETYLTKHINKYHKQNNVNKKLAGMHVCGQCGQAFKRKGWYDNHMAEHEKHAQQERELELLLAGEAEGQELQQ